MNDTNAWQSIHKNYAEQDWIDKPSIFAKEALAYFPPHGKILEIGGGLGQDAKFFALHGHDVILTDRSKDAIAKARKKIGDGIQTAILDASEPFPYPDSSFDAVYAHLSLHYFDGETTQRIFSEIKRVLRSGGVVAALFNAITDPEYGTGRKIEEGYFEIRDIKKRFVSTDTLAPYVTGFSTVILDKKGETYKDSAKGIHNLIRFIGKRN